MEKVGEETVDSVVVDSEAAKEDWAEVDSEAAKVVAVVGVLEAAGSVEADLAVKDWAAAAGWAAAGWAVAGWAAAGSGVAAGLKEEEW